MQTNHAGAIKGLGIVVTILAGLATLTLLLFAIMFAVFAGNPAGMPEFLTSLPFTNWVIGDGATFQSTGIIDNGDVAFGFTICVIVFVILAVASAIPLVGGIVAMKNANNPNKLGSVFGWGIAGAVLGFLTGNIVGTVLFVIIAMFANSDKKLYSYNQMA